MSRAAVLGYVLALSALAGIVALVATTTFPCQ